MNEVNIRDIDLNLLVTLDVLLREQSVTRAAERLGRSQPALSHALGRLRDVFGDPLLVSTGRGMRRTPMGLALMEPLERALSQVQSVLELEREFDPSHTTRRFALGCSDALGVLLDGVLAWLGDASPGAALEVALPDRLDVEGALARGRYDVVLAPPPATPTSALRQARIGSSQWKLVMRRDHPLTEDGALTLDAWVSHPHVVIDSGSRSRSVVGQALERVGAPRRIGLSVPGFLLGARAVGRTDLVFAAPHVVARDAAETFGLAVCDPPIAIPPVPVALMWHERWDADPGHAWFREGMARVLRERW